MMFSLLPQLTHNDGFGLQSLRKLPRDYSKGIQFSGISIQDFDTTKDLL